MKNSPPVRALTAGAGSSHRKASWYTPHTMDQFPPLTKIRQHYPRERVQNIEQTLLESVRRVPLTLPAGSSVAITVGSRGVANIHLVVKTLVSYLRAKNLEPFIVPAMGSHGGATAEGQRAVIESYGVTESFVGAPIRSSMEAVELSNDGIGNRVFMDRNAYEAKGTIVVNRIKVHTDFHGPHESGLMKMTAIGLGKKRQAQEIHSFGIRGLKERIVPTARKILEHGNIIMGIALVENAYDETMIIQAVPTPEIEAEERRLLEISRRNMPALPTDRLDVLVIDEMGKDVSGCGVDTNIIGRMKIAGEPEPERPSISRIVVADLTDASHGNAIGLGLVDIVTRRMREKIDFVATYENTVTSTFLERGRMPIVAENDRRAVAMALSTCSLGPDPGSASKARLARIRNTLHLDELYVSNAVLEEVRASDRIEVVGKEAAMFSDGDSLPTWA